MLSHVYSRIRKTVREYVAAGTKGRGARERESKQEQQRQCELLEGECGRCIYTTLCICQTFKEQEDDDDNDVMDATNTKLALNQHTAAESSSLLGRIGGAVVD